MGFRHKFQNRMGLEVLTEGRKSNNKKKNVLLREIMDMKTLKGLKPNLI